MNISKRTMIIAALAILAFIAALASLYFEQKAVIDELESIDEPVKRERKSKIKVEPIPGAETVIIDGNEPSRREDDQIQE